MPRRNGKKERGLPVADAALLRMLSTAAVSTEPDELTNRLVSKRLWDLSFLVAALGDTPGMKKLVEAIQQPVADVHTAP